VAQLPAALWKVVEGEEESAAWQKLRDSYAAMGPTVIRVIGKPTQVPGIIEDCRPDFWIAHAMNGIVLMSVRDVQTLDAARQKFPVIIDKAPRELRRQIGTFGIRGAVKHLMLDMKKAFDPERRLNPGRHIDGE
jgi:hypothetical protein